MAGGAAVWCWCEVLPGCCCPLLYSYVGRGGGRSPTGAGIICPARGADRRHHRPGAGCRSAASSARRVAWPVQRPAAAGCDLLPARHHRAAHGKRPTEKGNKKRGRRGGGPCLPLFSRHSFGAVILPGYRPGRAAAGIHRGPFFPAWRSQYTPPRFPRRIVPPFSLARILPASIALQLS